MKKIIFEELLHEEYNKILDIIKTNGLPYQNKRKNEVYLAYELSEIKSARHSTNNSQPIYTQIEFRFNNMIPKNGLDEPRFSQEEVTKAATNTINKLMIEYVKNRIR